MKMCCPHCGVKGSADDAHLGKKVRCPKCQGIFSFVEPDVAPETDVLVEELATDEKVVEDPGPAIIEEDLSLASSLDEEIEHETSDALDDSFDDQPIEDEQWASTANDLDIDVTDEEASSDLNLEEDLEDLDDDGNDESEVLIADELDTDLPEHEIEKELVVEEDVLEQGDSFLDFEEEALNLDESLEEVIEETDSHEVTSVDDDSLQEATEEITLEGEEDELLLDELEPESVEKEAESRDEESISMREDDAELILSEETDEIVEEAAQTVINNPEEGALVQDAIVAPLIETEQEEAKKPKKEEKTKKPLPVFSMVGDLTVFGAIKEAWKLTKGAKLTVLVAVVLMSLCTSGLFAAVNFALPQVTIGLGTMATMWFENMAWMFSGFISSIFCAGLTLIGVRRVADKPFSWKMVFSGFARPIAIFFAFLFMTLMIVSGFVLLILPGIYLTVGYGLTLPLILDKGLEPWEAMEISRKAIHKVWWKVFAILVVMEILIFVALPTVFGLIWVVPMYVVLFGVVYRVLFNEEIEAH